MLRTDFIEAVLSEVPNSDLTNQEVERVLDLAVLIYSNHSPHKITETKSSVYGKYTISLDNTPFSAAIEIYYIDEDTSKRYYLSNFIFDELDGFIEFASAIPQDTIYVTYYIKHTLNDNESTIPEIHELGVVYLTCHLLSEYSLFGEDIIEYIDNGLMRVRFDRSGTKAQTLKYLERYYDIVKAKASSSAIIKTIANNYNSNSIGVFDVTDYETYW